MNWVDRVIEMIVGRGLADRLERARLEKMYEGAQEGLRQTTHITYGSRLEAPRDKYKGYVFHRTVSPPLELPPEGTLRPRHPTHHRFQLVVVNTTRPITSPAGPPDITAVNLSAGSIHGVYSQAGVRPWRSIKIPPFEEMVGFGKYRRSIHADAEWQMQLYRANLRDFPKLVPFLGDFKLANPDPVVWNKFCQESARSISSASSEASQSTSTTVHRTGLVVTCGFASSTNSSEASSIQNSGNSHARKDSALSITSPNGRPNNKPARFPSCQSALSVLCKATASTATNEDLTRDDHKDSKTPQILKSCIDEDVENAVESDYESDTDNIPTHREGGTNSTMT